MADAGIGTAILVAPTNIAYVTGFRVTPFERLIALVIPVAGQPRLVVPSLEEEAARAAVGPSVDLHIWRDEEGPSTAARASLEGVELPLAVEKRHMTVSQLELIHTSTTPVSGIEACDDLIGGLRLRKDEGELDCHRRAASFVDAAMARVAEESLRPGRAESDVGADVERFLREAGGSDLGGFHPIVLTGRRSSFPHAKPGATALEAGDLVIVDFGVTADGYFADITRTFVVGREPDAEQRRIFDVVRAAQQAGVEAVRADNACRDVDRAARSVIDEAGLGHYFIHRTGHGLGLDVHEPPYLTATNEERLEPGMVVTVEPGVYVDGYGGVRIEDDVVVTSSAPEVLTGTAIAVDLAL